MPNATGPIILAGLIVMGFALFWARHLIYRDRPVAADDAVKLILSIAGWVCVLVGIGGVVLHGLVVLSPIGVAIAAGLAIMLVTRYRVLERRALLRCLSIAAQKGVPLNEAMRAFANERSDELGLRTVRLAEAIEAGMPLPDALQQSGTRLPADALLAVRIGYETGTLSQSLQRISRIDIDLDTLIRSVYSRFIYLIWIWVMMIGVMTFIMLKIVPVFEKCLREFEVNLPEETVYLIDAANFLGEYWYFGVPLFLLLIVVACGGAMFYLDLRMPGVPVIGRLQHRFAGALILRVLAMSVCNRWPMNRTLWLLSRVFPSARIRAQLVLAATRVDNGENWNESLLQSGLLQIPDSEVLKAASRVGNLEWALDEMADSSVRRLAYRIRLAVSILFPMTLFVFGILVGFIVFSLFVPLVDLIHGIVP